MLSMGQNTTIALVYALKALWDVYLDMHGCLMKFVEVLNCSKLYYLIKLTYSCL